MGKAAVTGSRTLPEGGERRIRAILKGLTRPPEEFTTGAQFGADTIAAEAAFKLWRRTTHRIVVPAHNHNNDVVALAREYRRQGYDVDIEQMEEGTTYLHRNDRMLEHATYLIAFPQTREEVQRSGTWHCIRKARALNMPILLAPLDGDKEWRENAAGRAT